MITFGAFADRLCVRLRPACGGEPGCSVEFNELWEDIAVAEWRLDEEVA